MDKVLLTDTAEYQLWRRGSVYKIVRKVDDRVEYVVTEDECSTMQRNMALMPFNLKDVSGACVWNHCLSSYFHKE